MALDFIFDTDYNDPLEDDTEEIITPEESFLTKNYSKSLKRRTDWRKACRKAKIQKRFCILNESKLRPLHWYSKNKIHGALPLGLREKKSGFISISKKRNSDRMDYRIAEIGFIGEEV